MKGQKDDFLSSMKADLATMRTALSDDLYADLIELVKHDIQKYEEKPALVRKLPRGPKADEVSDTKTCDQACRRTSARAFVPDSCQASSRAARASSAPAKGQQGDAVHVVLIRVPELLNEAMARKWMEAVLPRLGGDFRPARTVVLPFHIYGIAHFDFAPAATEAASALRTTRCGTNQEFGIIRDRPPPMQLRGPGLHYYLKLRDRAGLDRRRDPSTDAQGAGRPRALLPEATQAGPIAIRDP